MTAHIYRKYTHDEYSVSPAETIHGWNQVHHELSPWLVAKWWLV